MKPIRILIVDDNPHFVEAAERFFATEPRVEVVGSAHSGSQALEQVAALQPNLVLMDYLPDMNGIETTRRIKAHSMAPHVVMLTLHDIPEYRVQARNAGADGFIPKANFGAELLPLIFKLLADPPPKAP